MSRYRFGTELGAALRRAQCPPHPWGELYETRAFIDGRPRTACRRCYHTLAVLPLDAFLALPPAEIALALIDVDGLVRKVRTLEDAVRSAMRG